MPPVKRRSVISMAISIINIEIKDIPRAVLRSLVKSKSALMRMIVSISTLVISPLISGKIAKAYQMLLYITMSLVMPE